MRRPGVAALTLKLSSSGTTAGARRRQARAVRTIPVPTWVKVAVDARTAAARLTGDQSQSAKLVHEETDSRILILRQATLAVPNRCTVPGTERSVRRSRNEWRRQAPRDGISSEHSPSPPKPWLLRRMPVTLMHGEKDDLRRSSAAQCRYRLEAVHDRHRDVRDNHFRMQTAAFLQKCAPVRGWAPEPNEQTGSG